MSALLHLFRIARKSSGECGTAFFIVQEHSRIVHQVRLSNQHLHATVSSYRNRRKCQTLLVPPGKRMNSISILKRIVELSLQALDMLAHIRNIGRPVFRKRKFRFLTDHIAAGLQLAHEPIGHTLIIRTENQREFLELERHLIVAVHNLGFLIGNRRQDLGHRGVPDLLHLVIDSEHGAVGQCHVYLGRSDEHLGITRHRICNHVRHHHRRTKLPVRRSHLIRAVIAEGEHRGDQCQ